MESWPRLSNPPIVEGLIDIRVTPAPNITFAELRAACEELAADFPSRQERRMFRTEFQYTESAGASAQTTDTGPDGVILRSADNRWVAQFRLDGFTVSRLQPYGTWSDLKARAESLWDMYARSSKPTKILRVATRFINRVQLPAGEPFGNTFLTSFVIGADLPQAVAAYLLRVVIPFEEVGAVAIVTQSLEPNGAACILDVDAYSEHPAGLAETEMWTRLEDLRGVKNRLFFGSFTQIALERFK
jgi:uncharacterized protein (TIGR04255 family)